MPRSRGRGGRRNPLLLPTQPPKPRRLLLAVGSLLQTLWRMTAKAVSHSWTLIVFFSVVVGLVAGGLFLFPPRLTVESAGAFDVSDPLSTSFKIKNTWVLPLRDVTPFLGLCEFRIHPQVTFKGNCLDRGAAGVRNPKMWQTASYLDVEETFSVALSDIFNTPASTFEGGDIAIVVTFKPWISPFLSTRIFRYVAQRQRDGKFLWVPQPLHTK